MLNCLKGGPSTLCSNGCQSVRLSQTNESRCKNEAEADSSRVSTGLSKDLKCSSIILGMPATRSLFDGCFFQSQEELKILPFLIFKLNVKRADSSLRKKEAPSEADLPI